MCAGRIGQLFVASQIANEIGVSVPTIQSWLSILETSYIIFLLQPYHSNINKRLTKTPKLYFYDVGLATYLLEIELSTQISRDPLRGALFENMVLMEIDGGTRFNMIPNQAMVELEMASYVKNLSLIKLNKIYRTIQEVENDMRQLQDDEFEPNYSTISIGIIRTSEEEILLGGSCRILPNVTQEQYELWMAKIKSICDEYGARFAITDYKRPFRTNENSVLIKSAQAILEKMELSPQCKTLASTNEVSLFTRLNIECICIGAGVREENVHTPQEHVNLKDLEKVTSFYEQMIEKFCL